MKPRFLQTSYDNEEDRHTAVVLIRIIFAALAAYMVVALAGVYWGDFNLVGATLAGSFALLVPWRLLARGNLRLGGISVVFIVLVAVTFIATIGNGIHDLAIISYPVIIVNSSLLMRRRDFFISSLMSVGAMAWLVFGERFGLFVSRPYDKPQLVDFVVVATVMAVAIMVVDMLANHMHENMRKAQEEISQRKTMEAQVRHQSMHDALTGIYNRAFFEEELIRLEHCPEYPISIIVADVDNLKIVNDTQGHAAGDEFLRRATAALRAVFRSDDVLARIGGDEFAVLLPHTNTVMADQMLARVSIKLAEYNARYPDWPIGLSLGASTAEQGSLAETFKTADQRMYAEKANRKSKGQHSQ